MCTLETFKIDLKGLKEGSTALCFHLADDFFSAVEASEIHHGDVDVALSICKTGATFALDFHLEGKVNIPCDLCLDDMEQPVCTDHRLTVKYGTAYREEDDLVTVVETEGILDVAWFICEFVVLSIPIKHVHTPGKCNEAMTRKLEELSATRSSDADAGEAADPRWAALRDLNV